MGTKKERTASRNRPIARTITLLMIFIAGVGIAASVVQGTNRAIEERHAIAERNRIIRIEREERARREREAERERLAAEEAAAREAELAEDLERVPDEQLAQMLPYIGMPEYRIDATYLGTHADRTTVEDYFDENRELQHGNAVRYRWEARNGTGNYIFTAYVTNRRVVGLSKWLEQTENWPDPNGLPDLYGTETEAEAEIVRLIREREAELAAFAEANPDFPQRINGYTLVELAGMRPFRGMDEEYIGFTFLGEPDEVRENVTFRYQISLGRWQKVEGTGTEYIWYSRNGKHDELLGVYCDSGTVRTSRREKTDTTYWPNPHGLPNPYADGTDKPEPAREDKPPDPLDYDSAEEYADDCAWWFRDHGYSNPDAAAEDYWDLNGPW